jgi:signal transduction histidine kinase
MQSFTDASRATLASLAAFWLTLFSLAGAADLVLDSSVEMAWVKQPLMLAWLLAAVALLATGLLPRRWRVPSLLAVATVLAAGTVLGREASGLVAPWVQITMLGGMLLVAIGFTQPARLLVPASVLVVALVLVPQRWDEMVREDSPVRLGVPLMEAVLIVSLGLLAALIRAVLLTSAARADETTRLADERRLEATRQESASHALTQQMSLLHDTALNTLDAIALTSAPGVAEQRRRCAEDARRLDEATRSPLAPTSVAQVADRLRSRAEDLGIRLGVVVPDGPAPTDLPAAVGEAVSGALEEALLNVHKHAGTNEASAHLTAGSDEFVGSVRDRGSGFEPEAEAAGFGLSTSVLARMRLVGGDARVRSRPGEGTEVEVTWPRGSLPGTPRTDGTSDTVARLMLAFVLATTGFTAAVLLAEWDAFERPLVTMAGVLLLGGWGLALVGVLRRQRWLPTPLALVTVALACLAPFWTVAADQYCSSSFGGLGWVDPRIPLVVLVILTTRHWWLSLGAALAFVLATLAAGSLWGSVFAGCQGWAQTAALFAVAIFGSSLVAGRTLRRQSRAVVLAHERQQAAEQARVRAETVRAEQRRWFEPAVRACGPLLASIGDGALDPTAVSVRSRCREEAGYLRGLVTVARAPDGIRDELGALLQRAHEAGLGIEVRGDLARLPVAPTGLSAALREHVPMDLTSAAALEVTGVTDRAGESATLMVRLPDQPLVGDGYRHQGPGWEVLLDDLDGVWLELSWRAAEESQQAGPHPPATAIRRPEQSAASR